MAQVIFYWILVARHLSRSFDARPHLRPPPLSGTVQRSHQIKVRVKWGKKNIKTAQLCYIADEAYCESTSLWQHTSALS